MTRTSARTVTTTAVALVLLPLLRSDAPAQPPRPSEPGDCARLVVQTGHADDINVLVVSPDGRTALTGGHDETARLWDVATGKELRCFRGHTRSVASVALSRDGRTALTGSYDGTARVWDIATGQELRRLEGITGNVAVVSPDGRTAITDSRPAESTLVVWDVGTGRELHRLKHDHEVKAVAFSPDCRTALTGGDDPGARLWDIATGRELRRLQGHTGNLRCVAYSPDGRTALTGSGDGTARVWDVATGRELRQLRGHGGAVTAVVASSDGRTALTGSDDATARVWDTATGRVLSRLAHDHDVQTRRDHEVKAVALSPDGRTALTGGRNLTARLWDVTTGNVLRQTRLTGHIGGPTWGVALSPDGRTALTGSNDRTARVWDVGTGRELRRLRHDHEVKAVAFSPDGRTALTGGFGEVARLWDVTSGRELRRLEGHTGWVTCVAFSADGGTALTGSDDDTARVWEVATGRELRRLEGHTNDLNCVAFSPDGRSALTSSDDKTARLWDVATGRQTLRIGGDDYSAEYAAFSPDGLTVLTGGDQGARLWDRATARELRRFEGHAGLTHIAFFPDGRTILTSDDETTRLWDVATGREQRRLAGTNVSPAAVAFSPGGRTLLMSSEDGQIQLWDTATGRELCTLVSFSDGTWAVVDPDGRFDGSNEGDVNGLHWVVGNEPIDLVQLKERYYDPGLLAKKLGFHKEPLRQVDAFSAPKLYPALALAGQSPDNLKVGVTLTNRGGGIGRVVVKVNGKELTADARPRGADANAATMQLQLDLANDPRLKPGEDNVVEVQAFNAEGYLRSRGIERVFKAPGERRPDPPTVWAVVAGVTKYRGGALDLRYAAKDAEDVAAALRVAAGRLFGSDRLRLTVLTTSQADALHPTRDALVKALEAARQAKPGDVLIVYLAGHGVNFGGQDGDYYFLTSDARSSDLTDPEVRRSVALSSRDLTELIKQIPALKQVLILDTCAAGRVVERLTDKRDVPSSQVRALDRVKDRTGTFVLAGCAADAGSYEASRYAQGVLTYSLLLGMRGAKLRDGQFVDVSELFGFAADKVPELAKDIGGIQRPVVATPKGGASFDIGQVTAEDQPRIPLQPIRPLVLRANFQEESEFNDVLELGRRVDDRLRDRSARGRESRVVFVDAKEFPHAYRLAGRYRIDGERVSVTVNLFVGAKRAGQFVASGSKSKPEALADDVVAETEKRLAATARE